MWVHDPQCTLPTAHCTLHTTHHHTMPPLTVIIKVLTVRLQQQLRSLELIFSFLTYISLICHLYPTYVLSKPAWQPDNCLRVNEPCWHFHEVLKMLFHSERSHAFSKSWNTRGQRKNYILKHNRCVCNHFADGSSLQCSHSMESGFLSYYSDCMQLTADGLGRG